MFSRPPSKNRVGFFLPLKSILTQFIVHAVRCTLSRASAGNTGPHVGWTFAGMATGHSTEDRLKRCQCVSGIIVGSRHWGGFLQKALLNTQERVKTLYGRDSGVSYCCVFSLCCQNALIPLMFCFPTPTFPASESMKNISLDSTAILFFEQDCLSR